jgi:hypothetical protein
MTAFSSSTIVLNGRHLENSKMNAEWKSLADGVGTAQKACL